MEVNPITKIYKMERELKVVPHKKRQEFLCSLIEGMIKSRSVIFSEIADKIEKPIKASSIERRIQDFFEKVPINYEQLMIFFQSFIPHEYITLECATN